MKLTVLYFAWVRERIGVDSETITSDAAHVRDLIADLTGRGARYKVAFGEPLAIRAAVNQELVEGDHPLHDGDEVAFFPPMTGG